MKKNNRPRLPAAGPSENLSEMDEMMLDRATRSKILEKHSDAQNMKFVEGFLLKLLSCKGVSKHIHTLEILRLAFLAKKVFTQQGRLIEVEGPIRICGDIHGQYSDLIRLFDKGGFPPDSNYIFLGDYVDRGRNSLEVLFLCLAYKVRYPNNFFMLRGNHECAHINASYGFKDEVFSRRTTGCETIYDDLTDMMDMMPLSGLIGRKILCMHGGISPHLKSLSDLRNCRAPFTGSNDELEMDLLWADPMCNQEGFLPNLRGASVSFGEDMVHKACRQLGIDLIVRAHQVVQDGYEFFAGRRCITIFSAPNYCGQFDNSSAVCVVSEGLEVSFEVLKPETMNFEKMEASVASMET
ncbi:unnamed protein product [Caenorhabditis angaria]|uniref:Serine/threonine-protein phosphatase n=1 Tax=Caenorhabditis angaria TaxID=860376 RepID=A0A9P1N2T4_9PELO|nr:unnamed protein product [Caenorhabditis angaria]